MSYPEFTEITGWLFVAWTVGFCSGKMYVTFRQVGDVVT